MIVCGLPISGFTEPIDLILINWGTEASKLSEGYVSHRAISTCKPFTVDRFRLLYRVKTGNGELDSWSCLY